MPLKNQRDGSGDKPVITSSTTTNVKKIIPHRRTSYYDAEQDKYYLHEAGKEDPGYSSLHSMNGALRGKTLTIERLEKELNEALDKNGQLEREKREDMHKVKQIMMEKNSKQNKFIETLQANHKRDMKIMKEKLNKYTKRSSKLNQDNVRLSNENKLIKQELNGLKQEHGRSVGDKDGLMHQVKILSLRLSKSVSKMDEKNRRIQDLEQAVIRLGSRMELLTRENKRLNDINNREQYDRDELMRERGNQLSIITALLETRTSELGACEYEKAQVEALVDVLRAEIEQYKKFDSDNKNSKQGAMNAIEAAVEHMKKQLKAAEERNETLESKNADMQKRLEDEIEKFRGFKDAFLKAEENVRRAQDNFESVQRRLENELVRSAELEGRLREMRNESGSADNFREQLRKEQISNEHVKTELNDRNLEIQKLESTIKQLNDELKRLNEQLRSEESNFNKQLEQEKRHERELEDAVKTRAKITKEHDRHHQHATKKICKRLQKLRIKLRKLEVFQKWLLADHRQIRKNLKEKRDLVKQLNNKLHNEAKQNNSLKKNMDDLKVKQEHEIEELRKNSPVKIVEKVIIQEKVVVPSVQLEEPVVVAATPEQQQQQPPKPKATFVVQTQTEQSSFVKEEDKEEIIMIEEEQQVEDISIQATPQETFSNYNSHDRTMNFSQLIDDNDDDGNDSDDYNNYSRSVIVKKWKKMNMPSGDAEGFLQSFINRANSLRNEAADNATPGILRNTQQLITDVAERIAIETYDTGEYLYDISVEMQPTLAEAYRLRMANSNSSKVAEIKGKAAAVSSVARTRIRAALHLSRDGMLSWLLTIFSNAMKLLIELQTPGQVLDDDIDDGDFNSKEKDRIAKQIVSQSSEELIRICSEQWTKRRWPHTDPNANLLEEVRADVQVAAEEEYWRRYVETVSGQRAAGNDLSRHDLLEVEEPRANIDFWSYLDPLPRLIDLPGVERHIWSLVCLVNQQQVTETLGEIRLRRYDIHRKLLDTALYAAILRFVGHGRDLKEAAVAPRMIGVPSPEKKWLKRRAKQRSQRPGENKDPPFVSATRRNTVIGEDKGAISARIKPFMDGGSPVKPVKGAGRQKKRRSKKERAAANNKKDLKSFSKKKSSLGIKVKPREYRGRGGKSPSSGSKKLQRLLRTRDDKGIEKMIRGSRIRLFNDDEDDVGEYEF